MKISVIVVKYHSERYFDACIKSVEKEKPHEIIVVDNDKENRGYGAGCNFGAKQATGEILLFLNPDTKIIQGCLTETGGYFEKHEKVGVIGPKLYTDDTLTTVQLSCCRKSGLLTSLIVYGKFQKYITNNPWWNNFTYKTQLSQNKPFQVDVVSGAALAIRKKIFDQVGGFDPKIFLYFEENDLCLRVKQLGCSVIYLPTAKIVHYGGGSMGEKQSLDTVFNTSREYFFSKHYSKHQAYIINKLLK